MTEQCHRDETEGADHPCDAEHVHGCACIDKHAFRALRKSSIFVPGRRRPCGSTCGDRRNQEQGSKVGVWLRFIRRCPAGSERTLYFRADGCRISHAALRSRPSAASGSRASDRAEVRLP